MPFRSQFLSCSVSIMNSEITHTDYLDCYIRVSTTQQKTDGHSLEVQEHLGLSIAEKLGLTLRLRNEGS
jgi:hypothetical protein